MNDVTVGLPSWLTEFIKEEQEKKRKLLHFESDQTHPHLKCMGDFSLKTELIPKRRRSCNADLCGSDDSDSDSDLTDGGEDQDSEGETGNIVRRKSCCCSLCAGHCREARKGERILLDVDLKVMKENGIKLKLGKNKDPSGPIPVEDLN